MILTNTPSTSAQVLSEPGPHGVPVLVAASGLRKAFGGQVVLHGVDLELREGEVVLLRGENGSGKTTLLNILTGNLEPDAGTIEYRADDTPRRYTFPRRWWQELNPLDHFTPEFVAREGIGRTWQDIRLFAALTLSDNLAIADPTQPGENPLVALVAPGRTSRREGELNNLAHASLARLGLAGRDLASADKVSLGESKRVAIMRAVASGARILFLDEPLSGLDRNGVAVVLELLDLLVKGHGLTLVVVEHLVNQAHLREMVTTSWVLEAGRLAESDLDKSTRTSKVSEPSRPAWLSLLSSSKTELREEPLQAGALVSRFRPTRSARSSRAPALEIRGLVVQRGGRFVFGLGDKASSPGLDLVVDEGETVLLQAPNGWGKSTLLAVLAGALSPARGSIWLFGQRIDPLPPWARYRLGLRLLPAEDRLFPTLRTEEALALVGQRDLLPASLAGKLCGELSGGERKRLALLLAEGAPDERRFAILDEPFRALDEASHSAVFPLLGVNAALVLEPIISASETATLASPLEEGARAGGVQA